MKEKKEGRKNQTVIFHVTSKASPRWNLSKGLQKVSEGVACVSEEGYPGTGTSSTKVGVHWACQRKFRKCELHTNYI